MTKRLLCASAAALGVLVGCGMPYTIERDLDGRNATNYPGVVVIDPDTPFRAAVWAQEAYEAQRKSHPFGLALTRLDKSDLRDMELVGHEIEVQVATRLYKQHEAAYRGKEALALKNAYGDLFDKSTPASIEGQMRDRTAEATRWVNRHWDDIKEQAK